MEPCLKKFYLEKIARYSEQIVKESAKSLVPNQPKSVISECKKKIHCYGGYINQIKELLKYEDTH